MVRRRAQSCVVDGINKGSWTEEEDRKLAAYVRRYGHDNWRSLPKLAGLKRCGKSCRLRWINYLRPDVKRGDFTVDEEELIVRLHGSIGNKWSKIASCLPGRTDNEIKNVWHTKLKKRVEGNINSSSSAPRKKAPTRAQSPSPSCSSDVSGANVGRSAGHSTDAVLLGKVATTPSSSSYLSASFTTDHEILMADTSEDVMRRTYWDVVGGGACMEKNNGHLGAVEIPCVAIDPEEVWRFLDVDECCLVAAEDQAATMPAMEVDASSVDPFQISSPTWEPSSSSRGDDDEERTWEKLKNIWLDYLERELEL